MGRRGVEARRGAQRFGSRAERLCRWRLRLCGWRIVARNWRSPAGEIDIVARRGAVLAFVEVKARARAALRRIFRPFRCHAGETLAEPAFPVAASSARRLARLLVLGAVTVSAACSPAEVALRAGLTAGVVLAQERSPEDAARDEIIDAAIAEALFQAHVDDLFLPVNVDVMEGRVLLTGHVADRETADRAVAIARRVPGVRETIARASCRFSTRRATAGSTPGSACNFSPTPE